MTARVGWSLGRLGLQEADHALLLPLGGRTIQSRSGGRGGDDCCRNRDEIDKEHVCVTGESGKKVFRTPLINLRRTGKADEIIDEATDMQRR
jgi:hypothetical protein